MISIKSAKHLQDYKIKIEFNDGRIGEVDLKETITGDHRPIFNQLKDINLFKNFKVEFDTLIWPNELDIAPEYLYFQSFKDDSRLNEQFKKWGYIS
jgi:hypothetical protein